MVEDNGRMVRILEEEKLNIRLRHDNVPVVPYTIILISKHLLENYESADTQTLRNEMTITGMDAAKPTQTMSKIRIVVTEGQLTQPSDSKCRGFGMTPWGMRGTHTTTVLEIPQIKKW